MVLSCRPTCQKLSKSLQNILHSSQRRSFQSKNDQIKVKTPTPISRCCDENDGNPSKKRSRIKVGIIGGGMTPVYTATLLKQSQFIKTVNVADPRDTLAGAVFDAGHIDTSTRIKYFGKKSIPEALRDMDVIALMDEGDFHMSDMEPASQFISTSSYVQQMAEWIVQSCPSAMLAIFARPVTATLPMVSEVYKCAGSWNPNRIVGSTAIYRMRIESMTASLFDLNPAYLSVPIVGGADHCTVVPLLTRATPINYLNTVQKYEESLINQLRTTDKELASSMERFESPSLSNGVAAAKFIIALAKARCGHPNVICSAYVRSDVLPVCRFFANELQFGPHGVEKNLGLPKTSPKAMDLIERVIPCINELSEMGIEIIRKDNDLVKINV